MNARETKLLKMIAAGNVDTAMAMRIDLWAFRALTLRYAIRSVYHPFSGYEVLRPVEVQP